MRADVIADIHKRHKFSFNVGKCGIELSGAPERPTNLEIFSKVGLSGECCGRRLHVSARLAQDDDGHTCR